MKIVFMGTPRFAVRTLERLLKEGHDIAAVVTAPDKPAGRGQKLQSSEVKEFALSKGLVVLQPLNLKDPDFIHQLGTFKADLHVVVAFRMLPEAVWNMPPLGTYNLHASLLPKYRGAAPINWAIINGEQETGITTFKLRHEIDTGSILLQARVKIDENMTAGELHDVLMDRGAELMAESLQLISECRRKNIQVPFSAQDDSEATHAPKIFRENCRIDWNAGCSQIHNLIRGLSPYPAAFTELKDGSGNSEVLKIYAAEKAKSTDTLTNGSVVCDGKTILKIKCSDGYIVLKDVQLQGRKRMKVEEFLRGFNWQNKTAVSDTL